MDRPEDLKAFLCDGLRDEVAQPAREQLCRETSVALAQAGHVLHVAGYIMRDDDSEAISIITSIAAELSSGAVRCFEFNLRYAGAALVRQLVEIEYFLWRFSVDKDAPRAWLNASTASNRRVFAPARLRRESAGVFRNEEYASHCELGGHPNPRARILLQCREHPLNDVRASWLDLAQHLHRLWGYLLGTIAKYRLSQAISQESIIAVDHYTGEWLKLDRLATRLPVSWLTQGDGAPPAD